jgi:hypothetical protein
VSHGSSKNDGGNAKKVFHNVRYFTSE